MFALVGTSVYKQDEDRARIPGRFLMQPPRVPLGGWRWRWARVLWRVVRGLLCSCGNEGCSVHSGEDDRLAKNEGL